MVVYDTEICVALGRHGSPQVEAVSQQWVFVHRTNKLLHCVLDSVALEVPQAVLATDGANQRPYVVHLVLNRLRRRMSPLMSQMKE